jgi:hypothetical protein
VRWVVLDKVPTALKSLSALHPPGRDGRATLTTWAVAILCRSRQRAPGSALRRRIEVVLGGRKSEAFFFRGVFLPALTALIVFLQRPTASSSLSSKNSRLVLISLYYAFMNRALYSI